MLKSSHAVIAQHGLSNFGESSYVDGQGKSQPMFRMTQDGLSELAMSFSGGAPPAAVLMGPPPKD